MSEVRDRYREPGAFRMALTQRLRRLAESSPWTLAESQRQFIYDRFLDLGDWFTFEASRSPQMTAGVIGVTFALSARIGIREWESFNVDLVGEAAGMTGEPQTAPALADKSYQPGSVFQSSASCCEHRKQPVGEHALYAVGC